MLLATKGLRVPMPDNCMHHLRQRVVRQCLTGGGSLTEALVRQAALAEQAGVTDPTPASPALWNAARMVFAHLNAGRSPPLIDDDTCCFDNFAARVRRIAEPRGTAPPGGVGEPGRLPTIFMDAARAATAAEAVFDQVVDKEERALELRTADKQSFTKCGACHGSSRIDMTSRVTHSGDEPATYFFLCTGCGHKWKE